MSLINQMLQDLEKRGGDDDSHAGARYLQVGIAAPAGSQRNSHRKTTWGYIFLSIAILVSVVLFVTRDRKAVDQSLGATTIKSSLQNSTGVTNDLAGLELQHPLASWHEKGLRLSLSTQINAVGLAKLPRPESGAAVETLIPKMQLRPAQETGIEPPMVTKDSMKTSKSSEFTSKPEYSPISEKQAASPSIMIKEVSEQQRAETEYRQATIYQQQGRTNEGILSLENALKLDPRHAPARQLLISLLLENKRHDDAIRELKLGLNLDPSQLNFSMILARLLVERAKLDDAVDTLQKNVNLAQDRPDYLAFLAALQQKTGHHQEAVQLYRQALKKHAQNGVWWMGLAISLQADGKLNEAIDAYQQAKVQQGLSAELHAFIDQKIVQLQK